MKYLQTFENHILNYRIGDKLTCKRDYYSMCKVGQEFEIVEINRHYSKPMYQITNGKLLLPLTKDELNTFFKITRVWQTKPEKRFIDRFKKRV